MKTKSLSPFGHSLKYWRSLRGMSQLALAVDAGVSTRHISFIETGRSRPGKDLILKLSETLKVPPREQNDMMKAAGLPVMFPERDLTDNEMGPYQKVIEEVLKQHEPYPAFVFDRWWNIVQFNEATARTSPSLARIGVNAIDVFLADEPPHVENRREVGMNILGRLKADWARSGHDDRLLNVIKKLEAGLDVSDAKEFTGADTPVISTRIQVGDTTIGTIGTIMRFDTARDVTLDEIRIELHFPADEASAEFFKAIAEK